MRAGGTLIGDPSVGYPMIFSSGMELSVYCDFFHSFVEMHDESHVSLKVGSVNVEVGICY